MFKAMASLVARGAGTTRWQKRVHLSFYDYLASRFDEAVPWRFMNFGMNAPATRTAPLTLFADDEIDRCHIQLYDELLRDLPTDGTRLVEIGSGRGGGCRYIRRYLDPALVVGIDFSRRGVRLAATRNPDLPFIVGDAERIPLRNESVDILVNVESSHAYPSMDTFLREVSRVLRPGAWFAFADLRWRKSRDGGGRNGLDRLRAHLAASGLIIRRETDLSHEVQAAMESTAAHRRA